MDPGEENEPNTRQRRQIPRETRLTGIEEGVNDFLDIGEPEHKPRARDVFRTIEYFEAQAKLYTRYFEPQKWARYLDLAELMDDDETNEAQGTHEAFLLERGLDQAEFDRLAHEYSEIERGWQNQSFQQARIHFRNDPKKLRKAEHIIREMTPTHPRFQAPENPGDDTETTGLMDFDMEPDIENMDPRPHDYQPPRFGDRGFIPGDSDTD